MEASDNGKDSQASNLHSPNSHYERNWKSKYGQSVGGTVS